MTIGFLGHRIVPVIVIDEPDTAEELAASLHAGGIGCAEVTLRTPSAMAALRAMAETAPAGFAVGAGTVISVAQVEEAADAGATFVVSPGYDLEVIDRCRDLGMVALPGVATATEVQRALRDGLDVVKFFPADRLGGLATISALAGPFPTMGFVPSGGVGPDNATTYLDCPAVRAVSGSWPAPREVIARRDFEAITRLSRRAADLVAATQGQSR